MADHIIEMVESPDAQQRVLIVRPNWEALGKVDWLASTQRPN
jgi:hypothetical protein